MRVILYMAMTANGYVATTEGGTEWVSPGDWERFKELARETGNVVVGRATYDAMVDEKTFPVPGALNVVMTREAPTADPLKEVVFSDASPEEVIAMMREKGFESVLVAGGGSLNGSFMTDGLIDELYLTVEPVVLGDGIRLFEHGDFARELELVDTAKLSEHEVQLHYRVKKYTVEDVTGGSSAEAELEPEEE